MSPVLAILFLVFLLLIPIFLFKWRRTKRSHYQTVSLDDLHKVSNTGDVVVFSNRKGFLPSLQRLMLGTEWTHVGILYFVGKEPYLWEMTVYNNHEVVDEITNEQNRHGPQLVSFKERFETYDGYCKVRVLSPSLSESLGGEEKVKERFQEVFDELGGVKFKLDLPGVFLLGFQDQFNFLHSRLPSRQKEKEKLWCSEVVMLSYEKLGVLLPHDPTPYSLPHHFGEGRVGTRKVGAEYQIIP